MTTTIAVVQMTGKPGAAELNRNTSARLAEEAMRNGARLVVLPELIISGYTTDKAILANSAEAVCGPTLKIWRDLAKKYDAYIAGGICEKDGSRLCNTAILAGPEGLLSHYRKLHLFSAEKLVFSPGDLGLHVVQTAIGKIGLCVCYDLRFVEVLRGLALVGAEIVAVPTAWVGGFDRQNHNSGRIIEQANGAVVQANLNQVFVACASQAGKSDAVSFLGSSLIVDPYGEIIAGPLDHQEERILYALINLGSVKSAHNRSELIRPRQDRRTDIYSLVLNGVRL